MLIKKNKYLSTDKFIKFCGTIPEWLEIFKSRLDDINRYKKNQEELSIIDRSIFGMTPWQAFIFCKNCGWIIQVTAFTVKKKTL